MAEQLLKDGDIIEHNGHKLECSFVSYQEVDGEKVNFTYSFRPHEDLKREREETRIPETTQDSEEQEA